MILSHWRTLPLTCLAPHLFWPTFAISSAATSLPTCTSPASIPIYIPIRNVTLSDNTLHRGAAVSFGTPAQPLAFAVSPSVSSLLELPAEVVNLIMLGQITTHILMTVLAATAVTMTQGCSARANTAASSMKEVRAPGRQPI